jgi:hypothetical protein
MKKFINMPFLGEGPFRENLGKIYAEIYNIDQTMPGGQVPHTPLSTFYPRRQPLLRIFDLRYPRAASFQRVRDLR